jgi:hypothetical protein
MSKLRGDSLRAKRSHVCRSHAVHSGSFDCPRGSAYFTRNVDQAMAPVSAKGDSIASWWPSELTSLSLMSIRIRRALCDGPQALLFSMFQDMVAGDSHRSDSVAEPSSIGCLGPRVKRRISTRGSKTPADSAVFSTLYEPLCLFVPFGDPPLRPRAQKNRGARNWLTRQRNLTFFLAVALASGR